MVTDYVNTLGTPALNRRSWFSVCIVVLLGLAITRYSLWFSDGSRFQDLDVYRRGSLALLEGQPLYQARTAGHGQLVFTYPPFAAIALSPFAMVSHGVAIGLFLSASLIAYACFTHLPATAMKWEPRWGALAALGGLSLEPVLRTLQQGQINLLLAALVAVDLLVMKRSRGCLVGIAAGIKLIPGIFILWFIAARDWKSAVRASVVGLGTIALSWIVSPADSHRYWLGLFWDPQRSGGGGYPDNQSIAGVMARIMHNDGPPAWIILPLQIAVLMVALVRASRLMRDGENQVEGMAIVALGSLLASPVSWSHHWVWCVPVIMICINRGRWRLATAGVLVFGVAPLDLSPLGMLDAPRPVWVLATAMMPLFGLWCLLSISGTVGAESSRALTEDGTAAPIG